MESSSSETSSTCSSDETSWTDEEFTLEERTSMVMHLTGNITQYVQQNQKSTNTQLFALLSLMNAYVPEAYLLMSECQKVLGPPDPIYGGPPFEERMRPFMVLIDTSSPSPQQIRIYPVSAKAALQVLANLGITRSTTVKNLMSLLCGDEAQPHTVQFIKDLLIKREMGENGKEKFSRLVQDICVLESPYNAISVLETASDKMTNNYIFPKTLARFYYINRDIDDYTKAEEWAKIAIRRAPNNSYVADTLGQIYKNCLLRRAKQIKPVLSMSRCAFRAFKDVEMKADKEEGPESEAEGTVNISNFFNNRGRFGFMQVAKITFEKFQRLNYPLPPLQRQIKNLKMEVKDKFDFFERYLTYSTPSQTTVEPNYFWKDVALCYEQYTGEEAAGSTSFPGLIERLNRGLFTSKGRRAGFEETEEAVPYLEEIHDDLKAFYQANDDDVQAAERYILSSIILSNKAKNSPNLTPVRELQTILFRFLDTEVGRRSPEFYLLVLLLFWPEENPQEEEEEVEQQAAEDDGQTQEDEEQLPFQPDLQQYITFMEKAFERVGYAKYLRGRYLLPLFFLGKGSGLRKWIPKSTLDAIVEKKVDADLVFSPDRSSKAKCKGIVDLWSNGEVWQIPEIQDILLPVQIEPRISYWEGEQEIFIRAGGMEIPVTTESERDAAEYHHYYLGLTIEGPVVFGVDFPDEADNDE